ncbi:peptidyl-prolyl cis-trans isomerase [Paenibacillus sp. NPDC058071]|uniref:foldase protein PrsA n=1 Tax=Paenibacillus sp. NPDC058071 TaxID=3346326 RepID=UPI0036DA4F54
MENKDEQRKREQEQNDAAINEQSDNADNTENTSIELEKYTSEEAVTEEAAVREQNEAEQEAATAAVAQPAAPAPVNAKGGSKAWMAISAVLAIVLVIVLIKPPFGGSNEAVAIVNGKNIWKDQLYDELARANGPAALDGLIKKELIAQAGDKAGVSATEADIDAEIEELTKTFGSAEALQNALNQNGITMDELRQDAYSQVLIRKILEPQATVSDEEVKNYYDENKASFATPDQIRISHILVGAEQDASDIVKQLQEGGDFAAIAKEKSIDTNSGPNGGDLGFISKGMTGLEDFENAAFALKLNEVSDVIKTDAGFHIVKKTEEKAATNPTFEEKKEEIHQMLVNNKIGELSMSWMQKIQDEAKITNTLEKKDAPAAK